MSFGIVEIVLFGVLIYLLFFGNKLAGLGKGIRGMMTGFKQGIEGSEDIDVTELSERKKNRDFDKKT